MALPQIHWHEGLFLQPHHLQYQLRHLMQQAAGERALSLSYPYGLIHAELSIDALERRLVQIDRLRLVMPGGLLLDVPENTDLPALDIKRIMESSSDPVMIRLGVPLWSAARANTIDSSDADDFRQKRLYRMKEIESLDENNGQNLRNLRVRRINARLLLPEDDDNDMETIPLLRLKHGVGAAGGLPKEDDEFLPPCLFLSGAPRLKQLVRDLANRVQASRDTTVRTLTRGKFAVEAMHGPQFEQVLRLRTLNRFSTTLEHLATAPAITPQHAYIELCELIGELAALRPQRDGEFFPLPAYDHDRPGIVFGRLGAMVRQFVEDSVPVKWEFVDFLDKGNFRLTPNLSDDQLTKRSEYFLGIKCKKPQDAKSLAQLVEDGEKFKLMPGQWATRLMIGVLLEWEPQPPGELPREGHLHYFRLRRANSEDMWTRAVEQKSLAVSCRPMVLSDYDFQLVMKIEG